jgi:hypothetical protein
MTGVAAAIVKLASDTSTAVPEGPCAVTRITAVVVPVPVGVQLQVVADPGNPVHPGTGAKRPPLLRDSATSKAVVAPAAVQRIVVGTLTKTFSPPFGARTVTESGDGRTSIATLANAFS